LGTNDMKWIFIIFLGISILSAIPPESHPSLFFDYEDIPALRERILREPYSEWYSRLLSLADGAIGRDYSDAIEYTKSFDALSCGFAYIVEDDTSYIEQALQAIYAIDDSGYWGEEDVDHAAVAMQYAIAYDIIAGTGILDTLSEIDLYIRNEIAYKCHEFFFNPFVLFIPNNHQTRYYSALGMMALTIADYIGDAGSPDDWYSFAIEKVNAMFRGFQVDSDYGYAEGPTYLRYGNEIFLPFSWTVSHLAPADDFFSDGFFEQVFITNLALVMPDGTFPTLDDSWRQKSLSLLYLSSLDNAPLFYWQWWMNYDELESEGLSMLSNMLLIPAICIYDDSIVPRMPDFGPDIFFPEAGYVVFRTNWTTDADYILMMCEHGIARNAGLMHEHPDQTSIIAASDGKMGIISGGYPGWDRRDISNRAEDHNLILVDGEGPPIATTFTRAGVDGWLYGWTDLENIGAIACSCSYCECNFQRRLINIPNLCWFIADKVIGSDSHTFDHLVHAIGSVDYGEILPDTAGMIINLAGTQMKSFIYSTNDSVSYSFEPDSFAMNWHHLVPSTVLNTETAGTTALFLWHLIPRSDREIEYNLWQCDGAIVRAIIADDDTVIAAIIEPDDTLPTSPDEFNFDTDGWFALFIPDGDSSLTIHIADGTYANLRENEIFNADTSVTITISFDFGNFLIRGHCENDAEIILSYLDNYSVDSVVVDSTTVDFSYDNVSVSFDIAQESDFIVYLSPMEITEHSAQVKSYIEFFPNPFSNICKIHIPAGMNIKIYNISGKCVFSRSFQNRAGKDVIWQPKIDLPQGIYLLVANDEKTKKHISKKIIHLHP